MQRRKRGLHVGTIGANLDAQRALPGGRQRFFRCDGRTDALGQPQALEPGGSQDDGGVVTTVELAQARVQIATQRLNDQMRETRPQRCLATQAGGAHHSAGRQRGQIGVVVGDKGVARVFAFENGRQCEALRQLHRHILERMDGQIGTSLGQRDFQFLHEQTFAPHLGERAVENLVAACGHAEDGHVARGIVFLQCSTHVFGLPKCKPAFARGNDQLGRRLGCRSRCKLGFDGSRAGVRRHAAMVARSFFATDRLSR